MNSTDWFRFEDVDSVDSPCLLVYRERVLENIRTCLSMCDVQRLRPHVKTHKMPEVASLMMQSGITRFKCATIAEAEMLARAGARDVLLAYQPVGPKQQRLITLARQYPQARFSCLVDNVLTAGELAARFLGHPAGISVYIDLNVGMDRTGIVPGRAAIELFKYCRNELHLSVAGWHVYDGHIRNPDLAERTAACDRAFAPVRDLQAALGEEGIEPPAIVAGGSPTFPIHAARKDVECSPGTFIFWDYGYLVNCPEQHFLPAALVLARVISLPAENRLCIDLGHKSVAAENDIGKRVCFLNAPDLRFAGQSEEHLVAEAPPGHSYQPGDVLYGLPYHICPTVALYDQAAVIEHRHRTQEWKVLARTRKITV